MERADGVVGVELVREPFEHHSLFLGSNGNSGKRGGFGDHRGRDGLELRLGCRARGPALRGRDR